MEVSFGLRNTGAIMRYLFFCLALPVCACDTPSWHFRGQEVARVTVEGSTFDVRLRGNLAEAIRINPEYAPRLGQLRGRAAQAMAEVSGCRVDKVLGDQSVMTGLLDCSVATG